MKRQLEQQQTASSSKPNTNPSIIISQHDASQPEVSSQEAQSDTIDTSITPIPQLSLYFHPPIITQEEFPFTPRHSFESRR